MLTQLIRLQYRLPNCIFKKIREHKTFVNNCGKRCISYIIMFHDVFLIHCVSYTTGLIDIPGITPDTRVLCQLLLVTL